jgi:hypothetical protein
MPQISLDWDTFKGAYPMRPLQDGMKKFMDDLNANHPGNTPCCVQMSHALSIAGCYIGSQSNRRANSPITTASPARSPADPHANGLDRHQRCMFQVNRAIGP